MRFKHLKFGALKTLGDEKMVKGMPHINHPNKFCEACLLGKHARRIFPKDIESRGNDRKTLMYFLKQKSKAFEILKNFEALVKMDSGCVIMVLRFDRVYRPLTILRTPQQNGVVEKNRSILKMTRCILKVKAISCAIHFSKCFPTRNVKGHTLQETWSRVIPKVNHLRVFGSIAYAHVLNQGKLELDDRSVKQVFIGYDSNSQGYKLYNPNNGKEKEDTYDFFPYFEEDDQEVVAPNEFSTPPSSLLQPWLQRSRKKLFLRCEFLLGKESK
ncbi:hypothetical protein CR513_57084, partial [Mucuna pruriens]